MTRRKLAQYLDTGVCQVSGNAAGHASGQNPCPACEEYLADATTRSQVEALLERRKSLGLPAGARHWEVMEARKQAKSSPPAAKNGKSKKSGKAKVAKVESSAPEPAFSATNLNALKKSELIELLRKASS